MEFDENKNCVIYVIPTGKQSQSTYDVGFIKKNKKALLPLLEGMPTQNNLLKSIKKNMKVVLVERTFNHDDIPIGIGIIENIIKENNILWETVEYPKPNIAWGKVINQEEEMF